MRCDARRTHCNACCARGLNTSTCSAVQLQVCNEAAVPVLCESACVVYCRDTATENKIGVRDGMYVLGWSIGYTAVKTLLLRLPRITASYGRVFHFKTVKLTVKPIDRGGGSGTQHFQVGSCIRNITKTNYDAYV